MRNFPQNDYFIFPSKYKMKGKFEIFTIFCSKYLHDLDVKEKLRKGKFILVFFSEL